MESEDGQVFVKNLAHFVRTHERALANALQSQRQPVKNGKDNNSAGASSNAVSATSTAIPLAEALSRPYLLFTSRNIKPAKLTLTPHHLFYLLSKFEDLGVDVGPMTVRLENLHSDAAPSNYVSFLGHAPRSRGKQSDADSLRSVSSMRSVVSNISSVWSAMTLSNSAAKAEKQLAQYREDLRYLYSCFTKIPALRLSPDFRARLISGFEEFPFDTAVPLFAFKNLSSLEICDLDFRQFHGWDRLSEQLRTVTIKRGGVDDPIDILQNIVLDDAEKRRKRSSKTQVPTTPSTPGAPWPTNSPRSRQVELARSISVPNSHFSDQTRSSLGSPGASKGSLLDTKPAPAARQRSQSPPRPETLRRGSVQRPYPHRSGTPKFRRSSGSSGSSTYETTPRHSVSDLRTISFLPSSKWRFLRHLGLSENGLTHLTVSSLIPVAHTLQSFDLSGNLFSEVPDALASLTHLRALNLSNCMIDGLQSLSRHPLPAITTLNLRSNRLLSLAGIERMYSLERLDLRDNRLHDPTELARLTGIPEIRDLYVVKNPFTRTHSDYRVTIFNLFRSSPGHLEDPTIDTLGPVHGEKKHLVDRVPEPANRPVIRPPPEDEDIPPRPVPDMTTEPPMERVEEATVRTRHRRSASDMGPRSTVRRKKTTRRRIVELHQSDHKTVPVEEVPVEPPEPELTELAPMPHTPNTESDQPSTPETTSYQTAPTQQAKQTLSVRPKLDTAFDSPTPPPRIRNASDDDISPEQGFGDVTGDSETYRQRVEAVKHDFGANWLSALNDERLGNQPARERSFSPASRGSTVRPDHASKGVSIGGRTLG